MKFQHKIDSEIANNCLTRDNVSCEKGGSALTKLFNALQQNWNILLRSDDSNSALAQKFTFLVRPISVDFSVNPYS